MKGYTNSELLKEYKNSLLDLSAYLRDEIKGVLSKTSTAVGWSDQIKTTSDAILENSSKVFATAAEVFDDKAIILERMQKAILDYYNSV
ncbi:MAG: hypothetical protein FWB72_05645 [Firmicutes bacterium]|nr:hypothetical protein [Bacillota bacterium]